MLRFSKWNFIVILQFFLLIVTAVWNIKKQTNIILSPVNVRSLSPARTRFHDLWLVVKYTDVVNFVWRLYNEKNFAFSLISRSFALSNKSGFGKSWQVVDFMFNFEDCWFLDGHYIKRTLLLRTNGVHFIAITQWLFKRHTEFNQRY